MEQLLRPVEAGDVRIDGREALHRGYFTLEALTLDHRLHAGGRSGPVRREVLRMGDAVVVLPWDPERDVVLVLDQIRAAPVARGDAQPWLLETVAGRIDAGETPQQAAVREAAEEAGLTLDPARLVAGPHHYPSPGAVEEFLWLFVAPCTLQPGAQGHGGIAAEAEDIRTHVIPRAELTRLALAGALRNGPLALLTLWLALAAPGIRAGL